MKKLFLFTIFLLVCSPILINSTPYTYKPRQEDFNNSYAEVLDLHNQERAKVGVSPLIWNNQIAEIAKNYAQKLAQKCKLEHSQSRGLGENLFMGTAGYYQAIDGVKSWLEEKQDYDYRSNSGRGKVVGHYIQIVWRNTKEIGCGYALGCGNFFMVCNYYPAGNYRGQRPY